MYLNGIDIKDFVTGAAQPKLTQANMNRMLIPIPPLEIQKQLVAGLGAERVLVQSTRKLIEIFEAKIKAKLDDIWETSEKEGGQEEAPNLPTEPTLSTSGQGELGIADASTSR